MFAEFYYSKKKYIIYVLGFTSIIWMGFTGKLIAGILSFIFTLFALVSLITTLKGNKAIRLFALIGTLACLFTALTGYSHIKKLSATPTTTQQSTSSGSSSVKSQYKAGFTNATMANQTLNGNLTLYNPLSTKATYHVQVTAVDKSTKKSETADIVVTINPKTVFAEPMGIVLDSEFSNQSVYVEITGVSQIGN